MWTQTANVFPYKVHWKRGIAWLRGIACLLRIAWVRDIARRPMFWRSRVQTMHARLALAPVLFFEDRAFVPTQNYTTDQPSYVNGELWEYFCLCVSCMLITTTTFFLSPACSLFGIKCNTFKAEFGAVQPVFAWQEVSSCLVNGRV